MDAEIEPHDRTGAGRRHQQGTAAPEALEGWLEPPERLKAEERALHRSRALKLLDDACRESDWEILRVLRIEAVKHWPGRRLTIRYELEARRRGERPRRTILYAKLYRGRKGERIFKSLEFLRSRMQLPLRLPEPLGYSARWKLLVLQALDGLSLADLLRGPGATWYLSRFASNLADFHELLPAHPAAARGPSEIPIRRHDARAEEKIVDRAIDRLTRAPFWKALEPTCGPVIDRVREQLRAGRAEDDVESQHLIHRDLYPEQVLFAGGCVGLIDVDELSLGEREVDAGNFVAHLVLADLQKSGRIEAASHLSDVFLTSYVSRRSLSSSHLACYEASALLRLASLERLSQAGRSVLPWDGLASRLVEAAVRALS